MAKRKTTEEDERKPSRRRSPPEKRRPKRPAKKKARAKPAPSQRSRLRKSPVRLRARTAPRRRPSGRARAPSGEGTASARSPYDIDLDRNPANYQPLTPLTFLERAAKVFPERIAIIHGSQRFTYADFYARARKLASALAKRGIRQGRHGRGDAGQHAGRCWKRITACR